MAEKEFVPKLTPSAGVLLLSILFSLHNSSLADTICATYGRDKSCSHGCAFELHYDDLVWPAHSSIGYLNGFVPHGCAQTIPTEYVFNHTSCEYASSYQKAFGRKYTCVCHSDNCNRIRETEDVQYTLKQLREQVFIKQPACYEDIYLNQCDTGDVCGYELHYYDGKMFRPRFVPTGCMPNQENSLADTCKLQSNNTHTEYHCYCNETQCNFNMFGSAVDKEIDSLTKIHASQPRNEVMCVDGGKMRECTHGCMFHVMFGFGVWAEPTSISGHYCSHPTDKFDLHFNHSSCRSNSVETFICSCNSDWCNSADSSFIIKDAVKHLRVLGENTTVQCYDGVELKQCNLEEICSYELEYKDGVENPPMHYPSGCMRDNALEANAFGTEDTLCAETLSGAHPSYHCGCSWTGCNRNESSTAAENEIRSIAIYHKQDVGNERAP